MRLSFVETMRGSMRADQGPDFPVAFELRALHDRGGRFEVRGLISAGPLTHGAQGSQGASEMPTRGTLDLGLGALVYHLTFVDGDGRRLALHAVKHPTLRAPLRSMTRMPAAIRDEAGRVVSSGEMSFATRDLPAFLASWIPIESRAHRQLDARRRHIERLALSGEAGR